jgi:hypothetical protein
MLLVVTTEKSVTGTLPPHTTKNSPISMSTALGWNPCFLRSSSVTEDFAQGQPPIQGHRTVMEPLCQGQERDQLTMGKAGEGEEVCPDS